MSYAPHYIDDADGPRLESVTDGWVLDNKLPRLRLSADLGTIQVGVGVSTITVRKTTPRLIDGTTDDLTDQDETVTVLVDGEAVAVDLVAGVGTFEIDSAETGLFEIKGGTYDSDVLVLEVVA